jgi:hypothetical protein
MTTQVNKPAVGFLGMVEAKTMGKTPSIITNEVIPSVDMFPFWTMDRVTIDSITGPNLLDASPATILGNFQVPSAEVWIPIAMSLKWILETSGGTVECSLQCLRPPRVSEQGDASYTNLELRHTDVLNNTSNVPNMQMALVYKWPMRTILSPGMRVRSRFHKMTGGTTFNTVETVLHYISLPA